jgi:hypothetical protein
MLKQSKEYTRKKNRELRREAALKALENSENETFGTRKLSTRTASEYSKDFEEMEIS